MTVALPENEPLQSRAMLSAFEAILYGTSIALLRVASMTLGNGENDLVVSLSVLAEREICPTAFLSIL